MAEYTPSTGEIREQFARGGRSTYGGSSEDAAYHHVNEQNRFDRWLAQHDAEVRRDQAEKVEVQYADYAIGVFGPKGQNANFHATADESWAAAKVSGGMQGPGMRKRVVIDGEEFFTEWVTLAKTRDEIENWEPPVSLEVQAAWDGMFPGTREALDALTIRKEQP